MRDATKRCVLFTAAVAACCGLVDVAVLWSVHRPSLLVAAGSFFAAAALACGVILLNAGLRALSPRRHLGGVIIVSLVWLAAGVASTQSPNWEQNPWRWPTIVAVALGACVGFAWQARLPSIGAVALGILGGVAFFAVDVLAFPRLYPAFHVACSITALLLVAEVMARTQRETFGCVMWLKRWKSYLFVMAMTWIVGVGLSLRFSTPVAPVSGTWLQLLPPTSVATLEADEPPVFALDSGWDFRGRDIVIVTVDALREDAVEPQTMPSLSKWMHRGFRFKHAYTPTPNSSYALSSMHSGSWVHAAALVGASLSNRTLAGELRQLGYQTLAVYDDAIFSVDRDLLTSYARDHFSFEYRAASSGAAQDCQKLLEVLRKPRDRPVFFWMHWMEPHQPYQPRNARFGDSPKERYRAELYELDQELGQCLGELMSRSPAPVIIVTSDHGEAFGEHRSYYHGSTLFDEQLRVPLLVLGPDVKTGQTDVPVSLVDIAPTLLAAAGRQPPRTMLGHDLSHPERLPDLRVVGVLNDAFAIRKSEEKAICDFRAGRCQRFSLATDVQERDPVTEGAFWALPEGEKLLSNLVAVERLQSAGQMGEQLGCENAEFTISVALRVREPVFRRVRALRGLADCPLHGEPLAIQLLSDGYLRVEAAQYLGKHGTEAALPPLRQQLAKESYLAGKQALSDAIEQVAARRR